MASGIALSYLSYKFYGYTGVRKEGVLKPLGYTITNASKIEIFMSIMTFVNQGLVIIGVLAIFIASGKLTIFAN